MRDSFMMTIIPIFGQNEVPDTMAFAVAVLGTTDIVDFDLRRARKGSSSYSLVLCLLSCYLGTQVYGVLQNRAEILKSSSAIHICLKASVVSGCCLDVP